MSPFREIHTALVRLRAGVSQLTSDEYMALLNAVETVAAALHAAPAGGDPVAVGVWYHHERAPALAELADALRPEDPNKVADALTEDQHSDAIAARALQQSLTDARRF
jgi:hypothetical protein